MGGQFGMPHHPMAGPFMQPNMYAPFANRNGMGNPHMAPMMVRNMPGGVRPNMPGYPRQQAYPMQQAQRMNQPKRSTPNRNVANMHNMPEEMNPIPVQMQQPQQPMPQVMNSGAT